MSKALVAYFSASGVTADAAKKLAEAEGADLSKKDEAFWVEWAEKNS